jgi:hypothetical protein
MTRSIDVERALDAYLAPDGARVPDRVLEAALDAIEDIPQARRGLFAPWRFIPMNLLARAAAVLVVAVVAVGALALLANPRQGTGTPSASPTSSALAVGSAPPIPSLDATFVSASYGFQIRYPSGWTVKAGSGNWPVDLTLEPDGPVTDSIVTPSGPDRMRISVASLALPEGMTMDQFRRFASPYSSPFQSDPCPPLAPLAGPVTFDYLTGPGASPKKVTAVVSINGCAALAELGGSIYDIEVIAGGRGYEFILDGHLSPADAVAWLATVQLEPASVPTATAVASPSPSK